MKILHFAETLQGGVGTVMRTLVTHQTDHEVLVVGPQKHLDAMGWQGQNVRPYVRHGRQARDIGVAWWALLGVWWRLKPDVVHLHSTFAGVMGRLLLLPMWLVGRGARVIYQPHSFAFMMATTRRRSRQYAAVEKLLQPLAKAIICVSEDECNAAVAAGLSERNLRVVYNGVGAPALPVDAVDPFGAVPAGTLRMLFVGRFDDQKGFDRLGPLMEALKSYPVHLVAVGAPVRADELPPVMPNTTYAGWVKPEGIGAYFSHADVVLMPSRWEGFAMVPLEAMSHAKALVVSDVGSLPEAVEDGVTGYCVDFEDIAAVGALLAHTPRAQWVRLGVAGYGRWQNHFTAEVMVRRVMGLYQN